MLVVQGIPLAAANQVSSVAFGANPLSPSTIVVGQPFSVTVVIDCVGGKNPDCKDNSKVVAIWNGESRFAPTYVPTGSSPETYTFSGLVISSAGSYALKACYSPPSNVDRPNANDCAAGPTGSVSPGTPPTISVLANGAAVNTGWYTTNVVLDFTVTGATDTDCADQTIGEDGTHTLSCSATNPAGTTSSGPIVIKRDATPPTIGAPTVTPGANANGWRNSAVTAEWSCSDVTSGVVATSVTAATTGEGASLSLTGTCRDNAGLTAANTVSGLKVDLTQPAIAGPTVAPDANAAGWRKTDVTATWTCSDALSGVVATTVAHTTAGEGSALSIPGGSCADLAGNVRPPAPAVTGLKVDKTKPVLTATAAPPPNDAGWNDADVTVTYDCSDALSGVASFTAPDTIATEGAELSSEGSCTDHAGNVQTAGVSGIDIDKTAPTVSASIEPAANADGWHNAVATITFTCIDAGSDVASLDLDSVVVDEDGAGQAHTATCLDNAGNDASASATVNLDRAPPATSIASLTGTAGNNGWYRSSVTVALSAADPLSGVRATSYQLDGGATQAYTLPFVVSGEGEHTITYWSVDRAGNAETATSATIRIDTVAPTIFATATCSTEGGQNGACSGDVTFSASATDATSDVARIDCTLDGAGNTVPCLTVVSENGVHTFAVTARDIAGNTASASKIALVDNEAPVVTITASCFDPPRSEGWCRAPIYIAVTTPAPAEGAAAIASTRCFVDAEEASCDDLVLSDDGEFDVRAEVMDDAGNVGYDTFRAMVDQNDPVIDAMDDLYVEATSAEGATVTFDAPAYADLTNGIATCEPASATLFGLGETTVTCTAQDPAGNEASITFLVTVQDTTAPTISPMTDRTVEATGPSGATVTFTAPATSDAVDGAGVADCSPESGSEFGLGPTTVTCTATDTAGNTATPREFTVTVVDTTRPTIDAVADIAGVEATGPDGAPVEFTAPATHDAVSGDDVATCSPASGATFGIGTTIVTCTGTDGAGNSAATTFRVTVRDTTAPVTTPRLAGTRGFDDGASPTYLQGLEIELSCADAVGCASTSYDLDGNGWTAYTAPIPIAVSGLHTLRFRSSDASNVEVEQVVEFITTGTLRTLSIEAPSAATAGGPSVTFGILGYDDKGRRIPVADDAVTWTVTPAAGGVFVGSTLTPGTDAGTYTVQATSGTISTTASFTVGPGAATSVAVAPATKTIAIGEAVALTATITDVFGNVASGAATWSSSASTVASVSDTGVVTGVATGSATITATSGTAFGTATITVVTLAQSVATIAPTLPNGGAPLPAGETFQIVITLTNATGGVVTGVTPTFVSENTTIAVVNSTGWVVGDKVGTTNVTVSVLDKLVKVPITITAGPLAYVKIIPESATIASGGSLDFDATFFDGRKNPIAEAPVVWSLKTSGMGSVTSSGLYTAGEATGVAILVATVNTTRGDFRREAPIYQWIMEVHATADNVTSATAIATQATVGSVTTTTHTVGFASVATNASIDVAPDTSAPSESGVALTQASVNIERPATNVTIMVEVQPGSLEILPEEVNEAHLLEAATAAAAPGLYITVQATEDGTTLDSSSLNSLLGTMTVNFDVPVSYFTENGLDPTNVTIIEYSNGRVVSDDIPAVLGLPAPDGPVYHYSATFTEYSSFAFIAKPAAKTGSGGPLSRITITGPSEITAGETPAFSLLGSDADGNRVALANDFLPLTDADRASLRAAGERSLSYVESGITATKTVLVKAGRLDRLELAGPATAVAGTFQVFTATGKDAFGNVAVPAKPVTLKVPTVAGAGVVQYSESGKTGQTSVQVLAAALGKLIVTGPSSMRVNTTATFTASGSDAFGNPVGIPAASFTFQAPKQAGPASVCHAEGDVRGCTTITLFAADLKKVVGSGPTRVFGGAPATFSFRGQDEFGNFIPVKDGGLTITAPAKAGTYPVCKTIEGIEGCATYSVIAGPANGFIVAPDSATLQAGETLAFVGVGYDAQGQPQAVDLAWTASCGSVDAAGRYTAPLKVSTCLVQATNPQGRTFTVAVDVRAGMPTSLSIDGPDTVIAGSIVTFAAVGVDGFGNPFLLPEASFDVEIDRRAGTQDVCYAYGDWRACKTVTVAPGEVVRIEVVGPEMIHAGETVTFRVQGFDQFGNPTPLAKDSFTYTAPLNVEAAQACYSEIGIAGCVQVEVGPSLAFSSVAQPGRTAPELSTSDGEGKGWRFDWTTIGSWALVTAALASLLGFGVRRRRKKDDEDEGHP